MQLRDQIFENKWVKLDLMKMSPEAHAFIKDSGAVEAMWQWLPRLPGRGTNYDSYYNHVVKMVDKGTMVAFYASSRRTGEFAGLVSFMDVSRTHRNARIGMMWTPPQLRGKPYALAIQGALLKGAIEWRAKRIYWMVDVLNERQIAFTENKLCAIREGVFKSVVRMNDGRWADVAIFALVGDQLAEAAQRIENQLETEFKLLD